MADTSKCFVETSLCDKCSVLQFNDNDLGGYQAEDAFGRHTLKFDDTTKEKQLGLDYTQFDILPDLLRLKTSSEAGCPFCGALREAALKLAIDRPGHVTFELYYVWCPRYVLKYASNYGSSYGLTTLRINLIITFDNVESTSATVYPRFLEFLVDCEEGGCMSWLQTVPAPREQPLCDSNIAWIKDKLDWCSHNCCPTQTSTFLPTRLLDIGANDTEATIRLVVTSDTELQVPARYAALSYCWGTKHDATHQLKTTSLTLGQHLDHISFGAMTRVIQDAVTTARALSIRYLWVDALCIIQDEVNDWINESERMGLVYRNAYVTICTITASSCLEGFLNRPPPIKINFQSTMRPDVCGVYNLRHQPLRKQSGSRVDPRYKDLQAGEWVFRAWTYQEQQLSTRLLSFGTSRIYISCAKRDHIEPIHEEEPYYTYFSYSIQEYKRNRNVAQLYAAWNELVRVYAPRHITSERDKFPAISGLAKLMAEETGDEYVAGLWLGDISRGLLWQCLDKGCDQDTILRGLPLSPSEAYVCPSWSWAKHRHFMYSWYAAGFHGEDFHSEYKSIEPWCKHENHRLNLFGRITGAGLYVEGKLVKAGRFYDRTRFGMILQQWKVEFNGSYVADYHLDWLVEEEVQNFYLSNVHMLLLASEIGGEWETFRQCFRAPASSASTVLSEQQSRENNDDEALAELTQPHDAPIRLGMQDTSRSAERPETEPTQETATKRNAWGLLIRRLDEGGNFVRIGRFYVSAKHGGMDAFKSCRFQHVEIV
ncbi:Nn.00g040230.m01.CDS01 [Neocucurbitaria sp. VM-36]